MKLKSVEIENYRAIEKLTLPLDPSLTVAARRQHVRQDERPERDPPWDWAPFRSCCRAVQESISSRPTCAGVHRPCRSP